MSQIIATASLRYSNGLEMLYPEGGKVEFGPYIFENQAWLEDWEGQFKKELEKMIREFGVVPDYVTPVLYPKGDPSNAMPAPPPEMMVNNLRRWWTGATVAQAQ